MPALVLPNGSIFRSDGRLGVVLVVVPVVGALGVVDPEDPDPEDPDDPEPVVGVPPDCCANVRKVTARRATNKIRQLQLMLLMTTPYYEQSEPIIDGKRVGYKGYRQKQELVDTAA